MIRGMDRYEQIGQIRIDPPDFVARLPSAVPVVIPLLMCRDCGGLVVENLVHDRHHDLTGTARAV